MAVRIGGSVCPAASRSVWNNVRGTGEMRVAPISKKLICPKLREEGNLYKAMGLKPRPWKKNVGGGVVGQSLWARPDLAPITCGSLPPTKILTRL